MPYYLTREEWSQSEVEGAERTADGYYVEYRVSDGPIGDRGSSANFATLDEAVEYFKTVMHIKDTYDDEE